MDSTTRVNVSQTLTVWVSTKAVRVRLAMAKTLPQTVLNRTLTSYKY